MGSSVDSVSTILFIKIQDQFTTNWNQSCSYVLPSIYPLRKPNVITNFFDHSSSRIIFYHYHTNYRFYSSSTDLFKVS